MMTSLNGCQVARLCGSRVLGGHLVPWSAAVNPTLGQCFADGWGRMLDLGAEEVRVGRHAAVAVLGSGELDIVVGGEAVPDFEGVGVCVVGFQLDLVGFDCG